MLTFRSRINSRDLENVREISASSGMFDEDDIDITVCLADDALYQLRHPEDDDYPHDTKFLFAEKDGKTCAYACYGEIADSDASYELYWLATHNSCRGQGIGKALVAELIKRLKKQGGRKLFIKTEACPNYKATRRFYDSCGFTLEATLKQYYSCTDDCCIYGMCLNDCGNKNAPIQNAAE